MVTKNSSVHLIIKVQETQSTKSSKIQITEDFVGHNKELRWGIILKTYEEY